MTALSVADIIDAWCECPHLSQSQIDRLTGTGVSVHALSADPDDYGFAIATDLVSFDAVHGFCFKRHARQPDESFEPAYIIVARDEFGEPADLVAWRGDRVASWSANVSMLGANNLFAPRLLSDALLVEPDVLSWVLSGRRGVVIINAEKARWQLASAGPLQAASVDHGRELRRALSFRPRIRIPLSRARLAA
jgi:hypothetical protein